MQTAELDSPENCDHAHRPHGQPNVAVRPDPTSASQNRVFRELCRLDDLRPMEAIGSVIAERVGRSLADSPLNCFHHPYDRSLQTSPGEWGKGVPMSHSNTQQSRRINTGGSGRITRTAFALEVPGEA